MGLWQTLNHWWKPFKNGYPILDLEISFLRDKLAFQSSQVDGLDSKTGIVLASASLLTGVLAIWHKPTIGTLPLFLNWVVGHMPLFAIIVYLGIVTTSIMALQIRKLNFPPNKLFWKDYEEKPELETKKKLKERLEEAYEGNKKQIDRKICWANAALMMLIIEALFVATMLGVLTLA